MIAVNGQIELKERYLPFVRQYTGTILYTPKNAQRRTDFGAASCVYVAYRERVFAVTCEHVSRKAAAMYNLALPPSPEPQRMSFSMLRNARVLKESEQHEPGYLGCGWS